MTERRRDRLRKREGVIDLEIEKERWIEKEKRRDRLRKKEGEID